MPHVSSRCPPIAGISPTEGLAGWLLSQASPYVRLATAPVPPVASASGQNSRSSVRAGTSHPGSLIWNDSSAQLSPGVELLMQRLERLQNPKGGSVADLRIQELVPDVPLLPGGYKGRAVRAARLLHFALWSDWRASTGADDEPEATRCALEAGADPNGTLMDIAFGFLSEVPAMVFAASIGFEAGIRLLVEFGASVDLAATLQQGQQLVPHARPLHDAVYMRHAGAVKALLELDADVNVENISKLTPLHMAAWVGAPDIADLLVKCEGFNPSTLNARAGVMLGGINGGASKREYLTPLELAIIFQPRYPDDKLLTLAPLAYHWENRDPASMGQQGSFFDLIRKMIQAGRELAVTRLINGIDAEGGSDIRGRIKFEALRVGGRYSETNPQLTMIGCMSEIVERAPVLANRLLNLLVQEPYVATDTYLRGHAPPTLADFSSWDPVARLFGRRDPLLWAYATDYRDAGAEEESAGAEVWGTPEWKLDFTKSPWHSRFQHVPSARSTGIRAAKVSVLMLPGFLDVRILHAFDCCGSQAIWANLAAQGLNYATWSIVGGVFYLKLCLNLLLAITLSVRAVICQDGDGRIPEEMRSDNPDNPLWFAAISFTASVAIRDIILCLYRVHRHIRHYRFPTRHLLDSRGAIPVPTVVTDAVFSTCLLLYVSFALQERASQVGDNSDPGEPVDPASIVGRILSGSRTSSLRGEVLVWSGSNAHLWLIINVFIQWVRSIGGLCYVGAIGGKLLAMVHALNPLVESFVLMGFLMAAFEAAVLPMRGTNTLREVALDLFFGVVLADEGAMEEIRKLDQGLFSGNVSTCLIILATLVFTLTVLNLFIGILSSAYTTAEPRKALFYLQARAAESERILLEPAWPEAAIDPSASDAADLPQPRPWSRWVLGASLAGPTPYLLALLLLCDWLLLVFVVRQRVLLPSALVLAAAQVVLQAGLLRCDLLDEDIRLNGLEGTGRSRLPASAAPFRCLWLCHRGDFDGDFYEHQRAALPRLEIDVKELRQEVRELRHLVTSELRELRQALTQDGASAKPRRHCAPDAG